MADGDTYDQHGIVWWKTAARKLFRDDPSFEPSVVWSINKLLNAGNLTALAELANLVAEAGVLRAEGINNKMLVDARLRQIEQGHPDLDSQLACQLVRQLTVMDDYSMNANSSANEDPVAIAQRILAMVAAEKCCTPNLRYSLQRGQGRDRQSAEQIAAHHNYAVRLLSESEVVKELARRWMQKRQGTVAAPAKLPLPRVTPDQRPLLYSGFSS
jgi:hypothetical protein